MSSARSFLSPVSAVYYAGLSLDRWLRSQKKKVLPKPVISIGNLSVGGTGKTPLLIQAAKDLENQGVRPAILTRGYRGLGKRNDPSRLSDEVMLMKEKLPGVAIGVGANRVATAAALMKKEKVDVFLLDDGFQHWPIARKVDIVCIDATQPPELDRLLPAGRLREPLTSLRRAHLIVLTRAELVTPARLDIIRRTLKPHLFPAVDIVSVRFEAHLSSIKSGRDIQFRELKNAPVLAVSGVGNPAAFEKSLLERGLRVLPMRFPDHASYSEKDAAKIRSEAAKRGAVVVTTEKDWMKLRKWPWAEAEMTVLKIDLMFLADDRSVWERTLREALL